MSATEVRVVCPDCDGTGGPPTEHFQWCPNCEGSGYIPAHLIPGTDFVVTQEACDKATRQTQHELDSLQRILTALLGDKPMVAEAVGVADFGDTEDTTIALWNGLVPVAEGIEGKRVALLAESTKVRRVSR